MTIDEDLGPMWAELDRLRITPRTLTKLPPRGASSPPSRDFAMMIGPRVFQFMKSLPDNIGEDAFIKAFRAEFPFPE